LRKPWHTYTKFGRLVSALIACLLAATIDRALAEEPQPADPVVILGLGIGAIPDYEGSKDYIPVPVLHASYRNGWFYAVFDTATLKINLLPTQGWDAGPLARYRLGRGSVDNPAVDNLPNVDGAIELGGFLRYTMTNAADHRYRFGAEFDVATDVNSGHDGSIATLSAFYGHPWGQFAQLIMSVFTSYADDDYMDAYFGIDASDSAQSGLDQHSADAGIKDVGLNLRMVHDFTPKWGGELRIRVSRLLGDAKDSPVVEEGSATQLFFGALTSYKF